jgi:hypothetical protein
MIRDALFWGQLSVWDKAPASLMLGPVGATNQANWAELERRHHVDRWRST